MDWYKSKECVGIIPGTIRNCSENEEPGFSLKEIFKQILKPLGILTSYSLSFGHIDNKFTIPILEVMVKFNADKNTLQLLRKQFCKTLKQSKSLYILIFYHFM